MKHFDPKFLRMETIDCMATVGIDCVLLYDAINTEIFLSFNLVV